MLLTDRALRFSPSVLATAAFCAGGIALANELDVPVLEHGGDGQAANCASSVVAGLKAGGDGFLAVRSGPGSNYRKLDELHNGNVVLVFDHHGPWAGIVYGDISKVTCASRRTHAVAQRSRGWVRSDWLKDVAG